MSHNCFISFKKEDKEYRNNIVQKLDENRITGKSLDRWIDSDDIDYVMQITRDKYMAGTTVTLFLIGKHSSENEGIDLEDRNKQAFVIRELQATLYDRVGNPRDGLLGVVLPEMEGEVYGSTSICQHCGKMVTSLNLNDSTVIREFSENYWLKKNACGHFGDNGRFAVLCRYSEFMNDPETYIEAAFEKTKQDISNLVHYKDITHKGI